MHPGQRVLQRVEQGEGCWLYMGTPSQTYGVVWDSRRGNNVPAHVAVYEYLIGPVPDGHDVHHECLTKRCVRPGPGHARPMAEGEHARLHHPRAEQCLKGHDFTPANTRIAANGQQVCRTCATEASRRSKDRHRGELDARTKVCTACGAEYHPPKGKFARSQTCSDSCRSEAIRSAKSEAARDRGGRWCAAVVAA